MRVLYVNDTLAIWGGLERILIEKVNLLAERYGFQMFLLTYDQGEHPVPYPISPHVDYADLDILLYRQYRFRGIKRLMKRLELNRLFKRRLRQKIQELKPDVIVCARNELVSVIIKVKGDIPLVFESHSSRYARVFAGENLYLRIKADYYNHTVRGAARVVALTEGDASAWREINPRVSVIPNFVHLNGTGSYCDYQAKSVIFVGRFSTQKGIPDLLRVWEIVHSRHADWQLHIYGGYGGKENLLMPMIERMDAHVVVHEPTPDIFTCYLKSSILLLTSLFEAFGLVLPEAMSCGLPVVAFDCPYGPADIITDGVDGFLVKDRDIETFASRVCQLMEDPDLRQKMGQAGVLSSKRFSPDLIMPKWEKLFNDVVYNNF